MEPVSWNHKVAFSWSPQRPIILRSSRSDYFSYHLFYMILFFDCLSGIYIDLFHLLRLYISHIHHQYSLRSLGVWALVRARIASLPRVP